MAQMVPARWKHALENLREKVQHVLDRWLSRRAHASDKDEEFWALARIVPAGPGLEVAETNGAVMVTAELPGLAREDFVAEIAGDRLVIRGEKKAAMARKGRAYYYAEQSYGAFARIVALLCEVDADKASAKYKNGVLRLTLPKTEQARARRGQVKIRDA
jgi:HSP20 family protein